MKTWQQLVGELADADRAPMECLWQDIDGVHLEGPPDSAPMTSILWMWPAEASRAGEERRVYRIRLDGEQAYLATAGPADIESTEPWGDLNQVDQMRCAGSFTPTAARETRLIELHERVCSGGGTPVTFFDRAEFRRGRDPQGRE